MLEIIFGRKLYDFADIFFQALTAKGFFKNQLEAYLLDVRSLKRFHGTRAALHFKSNC